ncbi:MAG: hypothetical protein U1D97_00825 [Desulfuromonadales bacterium]|nr:hypothetical protein [Desulfuromonadales bacterium]
MMIKNLMKLLILLFSLTVLLTLSACGGGGGGDNEDPVPSVKTARVTIGIQRNDNTQVNNVGSVALEITLPDAFTLDDIPTSIVPLVTGLNTLQGTNYIHPLLILSLIKENATAFPTGNLFSFSRPLQSGEGLPTPESFQLLLTEVSEISDDGLSTPNRTEEYKLTLTIEEI